MGRRTNTAVWLEKYQYWQIGVQKDGKRRFFYSSISGKKGQRECHAKADAWLDDNLDNQDKRLEDLYDEFIEGLKKTTSKSHWFKYESFGKNWIKPKIGRKKMRNLNEQDFQSIIDDAFDKNGLSKKTLRNLKAAMAAFLKFGRRMNATRLLLENVTIPTAASVGEKRILQPRELLTLFSKDKTTLRNKEVFDRFIYAYRFQVATGLRPGELMGLMHNDIQGSTLTVRRSINVYNETTRGKNLNAKRQFILTPIAMEALDAQKTLDNESNYVFGEMCLSTYEKRWGKYCEHNGIPHTTLYELRHTFVSVGKDLRNKLKSVIGHSEDMDTFGTYGHEVQGEMEAVADELQELFKRILDKENAKLEAEEKEKRKSVLINVLIDKKKTARS